MPGWTNLVFHLFMFSHKYKVLKSSFWTMLGGETDDRDRRKGASAGYLEGNICHLIYSHQLNLGI